MARRSDASRFIMTGEVASPRRQIQGSSPDSRSTGATSGEARYRSSASAAAAFVRRRHAAGGEHRRRLQFVRDRSDHLDARDLLQLADLLHGEIGLAGDQPLGGKALRMTVALALISAAMPSRSINSAK